MAKVNCTEYQKAIYEMFMNLASRPENNNVDDVVAAIRRDFPVIPADMITEAVVAATATERQKADELAKKLSRIAQEARTTESLKAKIAALEAGQTTPTIAKKEAPTSIQELRDIRDELKKEIANSEPARKARLERTAQLLEERIAEGDFSIAAKEILPTSPELLKIQHKIARLRSEIHYQRDRLKPSSVWNVVVGANNAWRTMWTSLELSFIGRQGRIIGSSHPIMAAKAMPDMIRAMKDPARAEQLNDQIINDEDYDYAVECGVKFSAFHLEETAYREEFAPGGIVERIPYLGELYKANRRGGVVYLNTLKLNTFKAMMGGLTRTQEGTIEEGRQFAWMINRATGRAGAKAGAALDVANFAFFSVEYRVSRWQYIMGMPAKIFGVDQIGKIPWVKDRLHIDPVSWTVRIVLAKELARTLMGYAAYYALWGILGAVTTWDWRDAEAGKIKVGNRVLDPGAGLFQAIVLAARAWTGEKKLASGKVVPVRQTVDEKIGYAGDDVADLFFRYVRSGLGPMPGTTLNLLSGRDFMGRDYTWKNALVQIPFPITYGDIYDSMKEEGVGEGIATSMCAFLGDGLYVENNNRRKK